MSPAANAAAVAGICANVTASRTVAPAAGRRMQQWCCSAADALRNPSAAQPPDVAYSATFANHAASAATSSRRSRTISSSSDLNRSNAGATTGSYAEGETPKLPKTLTKPRKSETLTTTGYSSNTIGTSAEPRRRTPASQMLLWVSSGVFEEFVDASGEVPL